MGIYSIFPIPNFPGKTTNNQEGLKVYLLKKKVYLYKIKLIKLYV